MLYHLWLRVIGGHRVDNVLKNLHRAITRLEKARDWHNKNILLQADLIRAAQERRDASDAEALRAEGVATKLRGIVGL